MSYQAKLIMQFTNSTVENITNLIYNFILGQNLQFPILKKHILNPQGLITIKSDFFIQIYLVFYYKYALYRPESSICAALIKRKIAQIILEWTLKLHPVLNLIY